MQSLFALLSTPTPKPNGPASPVEEIPSEWENGGTSSGTCVVSARPEVTDKDADAEIPGNWESGGTKSGTCVVA
jgi:hypothetical protein